MKLFNKANTRRTICLWALAFSWLVICIAVSSQTGEASGKLSMSIARLLARLFYLSDAVLPDLNRGLRLAAHIFSFFVLCGLFSMASAMTFYRHTTAFLWPVPFCILFAFLDEIRKTAIPGRHCSMAEACLNTLGCILGCAISAIILWILRHRTSKRSS